MSDGLLIIKYSDLKDFFLFFFQAEDGIRYRSPSRGLGDVYKRQCMDGCMDDWMDGWINGWTYG